MLEFVVNKFIMLKLEDGKTNIYVNGEMFNQCKYLMLNVPTRDDKKIEKIETIDEVADSLGWTEDRQLGIEHYIIPRVEFWGHCSSLQAWYENDYNTNILHRNLAFPLLKKLADVGDSLARKVFGQEVARRLESDYSPVVDYIVKERLLEYLTKEEKEHIYEGRINAILTDQNNFRYFDFIGLLDLIKKQNLMKDLFPKLLNTIHEISGFIKVETFTILLERVNSWSAEGYSQVIRSRFLTYLEEIDKLSDFYKIRAFALLLNTGTGFLVDNLEIFLRAIDKIDDPEKVMAFLLLVQFSKFSDYFETHIPKLLEYIDSQFREEDILKVFASLISSYKKPGLISKDIIPIKNHLDKMGGSYKSIVISRLAKGFKKN